MSVKRLFPVLVMLSVAPAVYADGGGDPVMGKRMFAQCMSCHTIQAGEEHRVGPNLHDVLGRKAAAAPGFAYSEAMQKSAIVWDERTLDAYIKQPAAFLPGTLMAFAGVAKDQQRADIIAYLKTMTATK